MTMKAQEKERRQKARQKLLDEQRLQREERSQKALARSQAPVKKKVCPPLSLLPDAHLATQKPAIWGAGSIWGAR